MDCSTCRAFFSASFDGRLAAERRQPFALHLQACPSCTSEFDLYRTVFGTIRGLPDGDAPAFTMPNEVPGALSAASSRFRAPPRFARAAASILLVLGLVGTHVLVFQWSRDRHAAPGIGGNRSGVAEVANVPIAMASLGTLPPTLRDHVEATDLFIRTAAQSARLQGGAEAHDLAAADWESTDLVRRTDELRHQPFDIPERQALDYYLRASEDFGARVRGIMAEPNHSGTARAICDAATFSGVARALDAVRPLVASLQLGTSFEAGLTPTAASARLTEDARLLLEAKLARLAGRLPVSIEGFQRFDREFAKSSKFRPVAAYLHADALWVAGRYADAKAAWERGFVSAPCPPQERWVQFIRAIDLSNLPPAYVDWDDCQQRFGVVIKVLRPQPMPMKTTAPLQPLTEDVPEPSPKR